MQSMSMPLLRPSSPPHVASLHWPAWSRAPPDKHDVVQHPDQWWDDYTLNHAARSGHTQGRGGGTPTSMRKLKTQRAEGQQAVNGMSYEELRESLRVRGVKGDGLILSVLYVYVCTYVCIYIYVCMYVCVCVCVYVCVCICMGWCRWIPISLVVSNYPLPPPSLTEIPR